MSWKRQVVKELADPGPGASCRRRLTNCMVLFITAHPPPGSVIGSPLEISARWGVGIPALTQSATRRRASGLHALVRCGPLAPPRSGRAQTLRRDRGQIPVCDCPPTPLRSRPESDRGTCTIRRSPPSPSLLDVGRFKIWFTVSCATEMADRQNIANFPRRWAPYSVAPSYRW